MEILSENGGAQALNFAPQVPFVPLGKGILDAWRKVLPGAVYRMLIYAKRMQWLKGHTFFRYKRAAEYYGVDLRTVRRWMAQLLALGILRRVARTGHGDHFVLVETYPPGAGPVRSEGTKMSGRLNRKNYQERLTSPSGETRPRRPETRERRRATNYSAAWRALPPINHYYDVALNLDDYRAVLADPNASREERQMASMILATLGGTAPPTRPPG
ncbi:MAG TPA: hypothetical protein VK604_27235 [Bryobacteraceae bacterium]|nr:hypothetical protein [Bryobacteraceae bacterium]